MRYQPGCERRGSTGLQRLGPGGDGDHSDSPKAPPLSLDKPLSFWQVLKNQADLVEAWLHSFGHLSSPPARQVEHRLLPLVNVKGFEEKGLLPDLP